MNDMGKNYSPGTDDDFNEYLYLLDHTIAGVYVIAKDTYEMLYGNTPAVEKFSGGDYHVEYIQLIPVHAIWPRAGVLGAPPRIEQITAGERRRIKEVDSVFF